MALTLNETFIFYRFINESECVTRKINKNIFIDLIKFGIMKNRSEPNVTKAFYFDSKLLIRGAQN